jgi:hypothetical protein
MALRQDPLRYRQPVLELGDLGVLFKGFPGPFDFVPGGHRFNDPGPSQDYDRAADPLLRENQLRFQEFELEAGGPELIPFEQVEILIGPSKAGMVHDLTHPFGSIRIFLVGLGDARRQLLPPLFGRIKGALFRKWFSRFAISHLFPPGGCLNLPAKSKPKGDPVENLPELHPGP